VPTEAELKVETTEATKDTEKVTNLGTALKAISTIKVVEAHTTTVNTQIFSLLHPITVNKRIPRP
jgi:hypothetical protein